MRLKILNFSGKSNEISRKKITLTLFFICIVTAFFTIEHYTKKNESEISQRLNNLQNELQFLAEEFLSVADNNQALLGKIELTNEKFLSNVTKNTKQDLSLSLEEKTSLENWQNTFARRAISGEAAEIASEISNALLIARKILEPQFVLVRNRRFVIAWYVTGLFYLIFQWALYIKGLSIDVGEPIFNVIDVGFISIVVQYTGGPGSLAQLLYGVSILSAVYNYESIKNTSLHPVLVNLPYLLALIFTYFWACAEGILFQKYSWGDFAIPFLIAGACALITYLLLLLYKLKEEKND